MPMSTLESGPAMACHEFELEGAHWPTTCFTIVLVLSGCQSSAREAMIGEHGRNARSCVAKCSEIAVLTDTIGWSAR